MIKIPSLSVAHLVKAGSFLAARGRRTGQADLKSRIGQHSSFLRQGGPSGSASELARSEGDPEAWPSVSPSAATGQTFGQVIGDEAEATGATVGERSVSALIATAGLSAALTATVTLATLQRADDGTWAATSVLVFAALTVTFLAGRAVLAPSESPRLGGSMAPMAASRNTRVAAGSPSRWTKARSALAEALAFGGAKPQARPVERSGAHRGVGAVDVRGMRRLDGEVERLRRHVRIRPRHKAVAVVTEQGDRYDAEILDLSQSGVALEGSMPGVWIGSMVTVGSRRAKAVRMLPRGMALEFSIPIPTGALHVDTIL